MKDLGKNTVSRHKIEEDGAGQRVDNYLVRILKGVPKSHLYRILRSGEVRLNGGRVRPDCRLALGDELRLPPVRTAERMAAPLTPRRDERLEAAILFEDDCVLALNKPAGLAVHGGSGISFGVVEQFRAQRPQAHFLELVHRLDRATSGVLLLAKKRSALTALHQQLRDGNVAKYYSALVKGRWTNRKQSVRHSLRKFVLGSGERRVAVDAAGQEAHTIFELIRAWEGVSLLRAHLKTGRTHQIRVHLAHLGFPIAGDDKYGDFEFNREIARGGLKRMFLHASSVTFRHPGSGEIVTIEAPLAAELQRYLDGLTVAGKP